MSLKNSYFSYFLMYFFYYMSYALLTVLTAVYLLDKQFNSVDVSIVVSSGLITSMILSPIIGYFNDKYGVIKINSVLLIVSSLAGVAIVWSQQLIFIAITYAIAFSFLNSVNPSVEKMATISPFRYGAIRIWGTIGFSSGTFISGIVYHHISKDAIYYLFMASLLCCIFGLNLVDDMLKTHTIAQPINKTQIKLVDLFKIKTFLFYLVIASIFFSAQNVSATHLPAMLSSDGLDVSVVSNVISLAVLVELPLVLFSHHFMDNIKSKQLLTIVLIGVSLSFLIYAFSGMLSLKIMATLLFKHTMGMLFIMTNLKVVRMIIPTHLQVSTLAIVSTVNSIFAITLQFVSGIVITNGGYTIFYIFLSLLVILAIGLTRLLRLTDLKGVTLFKK